MKLYEMLDARGYIAQCSHPDEVRELFEKEKIAFYIGTDMTADSLHVGHFVTLMVMKHMQMAGHRPIVLIGGGTTLIGDPSGRNDMRKILSLDDINYNASKIQKQMAKFLDFSEGKAFMVNNADWLVDLKYIDFLRDYGPHFSINRMIHMESYQSRLAQGLTLLEFNYMPMQAYDFLHLYRTHNCVMQMGGNDQWSNILGGVDLIRRLEGGAAYGLTFNLLTTSTGEKMGKTAKGAVWLDPEKTTPYEFYQYFRNVEDVSVGKFLRVLTMLPLEEIEALEKLEGSEINRAKEILAFELTSMIHGKDEALKAQDAARALFEQEGDMDHVPTTVVEDALGRSWLDLIEAIGLVATRSEGRRLIDQNGLQINGERVNSIETIAEEKDFAEGFALLRKGKKIYHRIRLSN